MAIGVYYNLKENKTRTADQNTNQPKKNLKTQPKPHETPKYW